MAFGGLHLPIETIRPKLKPLFESSQGTIREGAKGLLVELVKWVGVVVFNDVISELRSTTQKEVMAAIQDIVPGQSQPTVSSSSSTFSAGGGRSGRKRRRKEEEEEEKEEESLCRPLSSP